MPSVLTAALLGFLLGLKHATDPDHVVAITTIVSRERELRRAAWVGALWGIGHSLTLFFVGGAIIAFRLVVPPRLGLAFEISVALILKRHGLSNLRTPAANDASHAHPHSNEFKGIRPLLVGVVHGLAGSAAAAILVLAAIPQPLFALAYLAVFGIGTVAGMTLVTALLAAPAMYAGRATARVERFQTGIRLAAGALSVVFGLVLARAIIVEGGLFSSAVNWVPK